MSTVQRQSVYMSRGQRVQWGQQVSGGSEATTQQVVLTILHCLFPAIYEPGWRPLVRMALIWAMLANLLTLMVILIIVVRVPLPTELPPLPGLPDLMF